MAVVAACEGVYLAVVGFVFNAVEQTFEHLDASGVAYQNDIVGQCVGGKVYVVEAAVRGQYQFA